jgi:hypothetical protein
MQFIWKVLLKFSVVMGCGIEVPRMIYCKPHTCILTAALNPMMLPLLEEFWSCYCGKASSAVITFFNVFNILKSSSL